MGVYGDRAVKAKDEYNRKKAEESIANEKAKTLSGCCDIVTNLEANFKNLDEKITKALDALEQMETHFLKQQDGLKRLQNAIAMTANHTQEADAFMRSLANTEMPDAITAYLTVSNSRQERTQKLDNKRAKSLYRSKRKLTTSSHLRTRLTSFPKHHREYLHD